MFGSGPLPTTFLIPGFKSEFDEYNDKWFVNQKVLRGGSFATPQLHIRSTYRNFFHTHERWMMSGFRCARDIWVTQTVSLRTGVKLSFS